MKIFCVLSMCMILLVACSAPANPSPTPTQTELPLPTQTLPPSATSTNLLTITPAGLKYCVVPNLLNLRSGPGIQYSIVVIEAQGTCFLATARNGDSSWVYISTGKYTGWAYAKYLSGEAKISNLPLYAELTRTPIAVTQNPSPSPTKTP
jgi:uncharacterized protein YgiM (DUF1202 family)